MILGHYSCRGSFKGRQTKRPHQLRLLVAIESRLSSHLGWLKIRRQSFVPLGSSLLLLRNATIGRPHRVQTEWRSQPTPAVTTSSQSSISRLQRSHLVTSLSE